MFSVALVFTLDALLTQLFPFSRDWDRPKDVTLCGWSCWSGETNSQSSTPKEGVKVVINTVLVNLQNTLVHQLMTKGLIEKCGKKSVTHWLHHYFAFLKAHNCFIKRSSFFIFILFKQFFNIMNSEKTQQVTPWGLPHNSSECHYVHTPHVIYIIMASWVIDCIIHADLFN